KDVVVDPTGDDVTGVVVVELAGVCGAKIDAAVDGRGPTVSQRASTGNSDLPVDGDIGGLQSMSPVAFVEHGIIRGTTQAETFRISSRELDCEQEHHSDDSPGRLSAA